MSRDDVERMLTADLSDINDKELWIFGAGNTAALYFNGLLRLEAEGFIISGYIDNDKNKWGKNCNGRAIVSLDSLKARKDEICVLICTPQSNVVKSIKQQLSEQGFNCFYHIDEMIFKQHKKKVLQVYDLFEDKESKTIYEILLKERMFCEGTFLPLDGNDAYFALKPFIGCNPNEVFVDCGSYVGDTIEKYIWKRGGAFKKIIGFEPDGKNFAAMQYRVDRLKREWGLKANAIDIYNKGVADKNCSAQVERYDITNGLSSKIINVKDNEGDFIIALDYFLKEPYSFLKVDVEGWEYKLLKGATQGIKENRPLLAICIYHNAVDFYEIPLLIHSIIPEYRLAVRHHSYTLADSVLYGWVP